MNRIPILLAAALAAVAPAAHASTPGGNGPLVVSQDADGRLTSDLFSLPGPLRLTRSAEDEYVGGAEPAPYGGSLLVFTNRTASGLATLVPSTGALAEVPNPLGLKYDPVGASDEVSFDPGGGSYATATKDGIVQGYFDGTPPRTLVPAHGRRLEHARWSPDGRRFAVEVAGDGLWLYSARSGRALRRIARRGADADWSPDSRRIVYRTPYRHEEDGGATGGNLFVVDNDGTHRRSLVHREHLAETDPAWSPDGRSIAFVELDYSAGDVGFRVHPSVWSIPARGGDARRLARLDEPYVEEGYFHAPELTWVPAPGAGEPTVGRARIRSRTVSLRHPVARVRALEAGALRVQVHLGGQPVLAGHGDPAPAGRRRIRLHRVGAARGRDLRGRRATLTVTLVTRGNQPGEEPASAARRIRLIP